MKIIKLACFNIFFGWLAVSPSWAGEPGLVTATGFGTVDQENIKIAMQGKMLAKRAAQLDAQRQISEMVKGLQITSGTTVEDYEVTSDITATRVKTWLRGVFPLDEKIIEQDGTWVAEVKVGLCLTNESEICKGKESLQAIDKEQSN
jgi:hypothetical protein